MASAQKLSESLGAIGTNFLIISDTIDLKPESQFIIKNAEIFYDYGTRNTDNYSYGGGYESFHFEFSTKKTLSIEYVKNPVCGYELSFYDNDNIIATLCFSSNTYPFRNPNKVSIEGNSEIRFYSFDLIDLPLSVLDKTKKINIKRIKSIKEKEWLLKKR